MGHIMGRISSHFRGSLSPSYHVTIYVLISSKPQDIRLPLNYE